MKKLFTLFVATIFMFIIPTISMAQPRHVEYRYPTPDRVYPGYVYRCYTVLFPVPHDVCEYVRVYTPTHHSYRPAPPPPRHNNHRPAPMNNHHGPNNHPGPNHHK